MPGFFPLDEEPSCACMLRSSCTVVATRRGLGRKKEGTRGEGPTEQHSRTYPLRPLSIPLILLYILLYQRLFKLILSFQQNASAIALVRFESYLVSCGDMKLGRVTFPC